ncbi:hypothetical protein [Paraburkholderia youngii]|uniref:hypothetical protein n=1 Tax=Paraburkholderia youngii TaxID=2782701 RepID=UPI001FE2929F|nr:hypothetical protein [Paraburkholderia youngii]
MVIIAIMRLTREELACPRVAKLQHHVRFTKHIGQPGKADTCPTGFPHHLNPMLERERELAEHLRKERLLRWGILRDNFEIALLARLELLLINAVADAKSAHLHEVRKHRVRMVAIAETFNQGDEVFLMRVTGLLMFALCALAAHMMSKGRTSTRP